MPRFVLVIEAEGVWREGIREGAFLPRVGEKVVVRLDTPSETVRSYVRVRQVMHPDDGLPVVLVESVGRKVIDPWGDVWKDASERTREWAQAQL